MYSHLGIPSHKMNLMIFNDYYQLDKSFHNYVIIYTYDKVMKKLNLRYESGFISKKEYVRLVREHLNNYYNLRYGNSILSNRRKIIKGE